MKSDCISTGKHVRMGKTPCMGVCMVITFMVYLWRISEDGCGAAYS